jgi:hypothetical protein
MAAAALGPHDEMPGQSHAHGLEPGPGRDRYVHDRESDRDAEPAVDHIVEQAVARIVVVLGVAPEAYFLEQELGYGRRRVVDVHLGGEPLGCPVPERIEPGEPRLEVETRLGLGGDPEGSLGQRASIGCPGQRHEPAARIHDDEA